MKVLSVNLCQPQTVTINGRPVSTGIYKKAVTGRVRVLPDHLEGDGQADLQNHGGTFKAVYAYPHEHYAYWEAHLRHAPLEFGAFGENLTITGLSEESACVGDVLQIGTARLQITQPRVPCFKLGHKFCRPQLVKEFHESRRVGFYLRVLEQGTIGAEDPIYLTERDSTKLSVIDIWRVCELGEADEALIERARMLDALTPSWQEKLRR